VIGGYRDQASGAAPAADAQAPERLTTRQREILQLIAEGRTTKEIAQMLTLSAKTVEMHRAQLMERLDIHDVAGLVRYALRTGIISGDS
jgi:DNA-binding NarL/FixJ family response regulator